MTNKVGPQDPFHSISDSSETLKTPRLAEDQKIQGIAKRKKEGIDASSDNPLKSKPVRQIASGSFIERTRSSFLQVFSPSSWKKSIKVSVTAGEESCSMETSLECNRGNSPTESLSSTQSSKDRSELEKLIDQKEKSQDLEEKIGTLKEMIRYIREVASVFPTLDEIKGSIEEVSSAYEAYQRKNASQDEIEYMKEALVMLKEIALVQDELESLHISQEAPFRFEDKHRSLQNELFSIEQLLTEPPSSKDILTSAKYNLILVKKEDLLLSRQEYFEKLSKMEANTVSELNKLRGKIRSVERENSEYPSAFTALNMMFLEKQFQFLERKMDTLNRIMTELQEEAKQIFPSYEKCKELEDAFNEDWRQICLTIIQAPAASRLEALEAINQTNCPKEVKEAFSKLLRTGDLGASVLDYKKMCSLLDYMHLILT